MRSLLPFYNSLVEGLLDMCVLLCSSYVGEREKKQSNIVVSHDIVFVCFHFEGVITKCF